MSTIQLKPFVFSQEERDFIEHQEKLRQEMLEVFGIGNLEVGVVSNYTSEEVHSAKERFYQMLLDADWIA